MSDRINRPCLPPAREPRGRGGEAAALIPVGGTRQRYCQQQGDRTNEGTLETTEQSENCRIVSKWAVACVVRLEPRNISMDHTVRLRFWSSKLGEFGRPCCNGSQIDCNIGLTCPMVVLCMGGNSGHLGKQRVV